MELPGASMDAVAFQRCKINIYSPKNEIFRCVFCYISVYILVGREGKHLKKHKTISKYCD